MLSLHRLRRSVERRPSVAAGAALAIVAAVSAVRYAAVHPGGAGTTAALVLGLGVAAAAAVSAVGAGGRRDVPLLTGLAAPTILLVLAAPSAAWCVVPLVVLLQVAVRPVPATITSAVAVTAAAASVPRLTGDADPGTFVGCLVAGFVFVGAVALSRAALAARARTVRQLVATRARLVAAERLASVLEERQHLAAELHDTVVQSVAGALFLTEAAERSNDGHLTDQARRALRTAVSDARAIVARLDAGAPSAEPLADGIAAAGARVGASVAVLGAPSPVPPLGALALLRTAQGAVGNAERHASARRIDVTLRYRTDHVELQVADDGVGFDPDVPVEPGVDGGHGLVIMRRRLAAVGGTLDIRSGDGGTVLTATVPTEER